MGGGKHSGGENIRLPILGVKKFSSPAARSERKKETKKGFRLSHFFGLAQEEEAAQEEEDVPDPENDDALAESVNARNGFQA